MDPNPYASPKCDAEEIVTSLGKRKRGPIAMGISGFFAGGFIGATTGAMAAGTLGIVIALLTLSNEIQAEVDVYYTFEGPELVFGGAILGAMVGGFCGSLIGPIAGSISAILTPKNRKRFTVVLALIGSLAGAAGGILGAEILLYLFGGDVGLPRAAMPILGALLGCGFGAVGGFSLGRGLTTLTWGAPTKAPNIEPE